MRATVVSPTSVSRTPLAGESRYAAFRAAGEPLRRSKPTPARADRAPGLAYTELWFTDLLWPELDVPTLERALDDFAARERRFGLTSAQLEAAAPQPDIIPR